jgi:hypothetical protein
LAPVQAIRREVAAAKHKSELGGATRPVRGLPPRRCRIAAAGSASPDSRSFDMGKSNPFDAVRLVQALAEGTSACEPGWTVLHAAAAIDQVAALGIFLERGVAVDAATRAGDTALHVAARCGHLACVQRLLRAGADLRRHDRRGLRADQAAAANGHVRVAALLEAALGRQHPTGGSP